MSSTGDNALQSLYGRGHVNATRTRECVAMPGKREQSVRTPSIIARRLVEFWPEYPAMDPCSCPGQVVLAHEYPENGLAVPWPLRTFCNPPYGELERWLWHSSGTEIIWLVPVRTHRVWFRQWWSTLDVKLGLDPIAFVGFKDDFPAPLMLGYRGERAGEFVQVFGDLGSAL